MTSKPFFSILLPAKGRPDLVRDALDSVLEQSYTDFEVVVSNNGAQAEVREAIGSLLADPRVRYLEQPKVLAMPEHWETISLAASGRYLMVLPDRSVLKQGALATIARLHEQGGPGADIVTWSWDLYYNEIGLLVPFAGKSSQAVVLDAATVAVDSLRLDAGYPTALPRGLNSSVSMELVQKIRARLGVAFAAINPDFSFAYACTLSHPQLTYLDQALMISQGLNVSNGGNAYRTDASAYVATLGLDEPIRYSPIRGMFVENVIAEDFFAACHHFGREDLLARMARADLYLKCLAELDEKRSAALLPRQRIEELSQSIEVALKSEPDEVRQRVQAVRDQPVALRARARRGLKRLLGPRLASLRPFLLRLRGGTRYPSVLVASGHRPA